MSLVTDFAPGMRVRYVGQKQNRNGTPYQGSAATVIKPIKSRKVVHIRWDDPKEPTFDASPANLAALGE